MKESKKISSSSMKHCQWTEGSIENPELKQCWSLTPEEEARLLEMIELRFAATKICINEAINAKCTYKEGTVYFTDRAGEHARRLARLALFITGREDNLKRAFPSLLVPAWEHIQRNNEARARARKEKANGKK